MDIHIHGNPEDLLAAGLPTPSLVTDMSVSKQKTSVIKCSCVCCSGAVISGNHCTPRN